MSPLVNSVTHICMQLYAYMSPCYDAPFNHLAAREIQPDSVTFARRSVVSDMLLTASCQLCSCLLFVLRNNTVVDDVQCAVLIWHCKFEIICASNVKRISIAYLADDVIPKHGYSEQV